MSVLRQALFAIVVCYSCVGLSLVIAWPSSTLKLFSSTNTTLNRPMTEAEVALFGSFASVGALVATPVAGFLLDVIGRKYSCILFSLPHLMAWVIVSLTNSVEAILAARFISGLGGCMLLLVSVYVSELCQESIRGMMTSGAMIAYGLGMLMSYLVGGCLNYASMNYVFLSLTLFGILILLPLKESPMFLMKKGREKEAAGSIAFFRGYNESSKEVTEELITIRRALNPDIDDTPEEEKLKPEFEERKKLSKWEFIKRSPSTRRAIFVALTLYTAAIFQGLVVVQVYAEPLFTEAIPNMSSTICSVLFAIITTVSCCIAGFLMDVTGRRMLMIFASIGSGVCCVMLGSQIHLHWGPHWVTALFIYLFSMTFTFGSGTVPFVVAAEIFVPEVKSIVSMICMEWAWICNFIILFIFNPLVTLMGLGPVFYLFAMVCFGTAIFCVFFMPETKGVPVDVIQTLFVKKRLPQDDC